MSDSWIDACGRSGSFVDPVDHLLMDTAAQKKFGFDMRTSYERAQHQLLLTGLHVFFTPGIASMPNDLVAQLLDAICGSACINVQMYPLA